ncbi:MAG: LysR family transcriptional regulator [Propionibacteriaceae bacterium]|nr:LysR family transcriptional regulator [Propionibacteriaceae bacterium]
MTWPTLLDLELFVRADQLGSLSAAARELGLSQPEASRRLARLESQLDLHLMVRSHTGSHLTRQGELVAQWSHQLLDQASQWQAGVAALHGRKATHLEIAASQTIAEFLAPHWLANFRRTHADVVTRMEVHNSARVIELVHAGSVVLGLVEAPEIPEWLDTVTVGRDQLVVVVAPGHPWQHRRKITQEELAATPLVVREPGSGTRQTLELSMAGKASAVPVLELASNAAVLSAATSGAGPAVISALAARGAIADGRLLRVALSGPVLERQLRAVWKRGTAPSPTAKSFVDSITTHA